MSEEIKIDTEISGEEIVIDLSRVPIRPTGKKEIQQLEMALIIATLYSPEVLELIRDPIERATWVDSLAVAAAALARQKAGYSISRIAEEVGRSETMIRAHLSGKTKAGKLVLQTYEKLKRGELKVVVPFIKVPKEMAERVEELERELKNIRQHYEEKMRELREQLEKTKKEYEEKIRDYEEKMKKYEEELAEKSKKISEYEEKIRSLEGEIEELRKSSEELKKELESKTKLIESIKEKISVLKEIVELLEKA
jgi:probable regulatory domain-containing protein